MIPFENQIEIARRVDEVFAYVADLGNLPAWNYAIDKTDKVTSGPVGIGTQYRQRRSLPRLSDETIEITEYQHPPGWLSTGTLARSPPVCPTRSSRSRESPV